MKLYVVFNNHSNNPELLADWGFSALLETKTENILFDTGSNGPILMENMSRLGLKAHEIKKVVISHNHWDHIGGLVEIARKNRGLTVYLTELHKELGETLKDLGARVIVAKSQIKISDSINTTDVFENSIKELALVCNTSKGKVILTGCSHPGIVKILNAIPGPKYLLLGGLHLFRTPIEKLYEISRELEKLRIKFIAPSHCTGEDVIAYFKDYFEKNFLYGGLGAKFSL